MRDVGDERGGARVILVGRTGLEQTLRARDEIELLRVRNTLDAIGELASPIDDASPSRTAIVVGEGVMPDARDSRDFVRAARDLSPDVIVLGAAGAQRIDDGFDGTVANETELMRALSRRAEPRAPRSRAEEQAPADPAQGNGAGRNGAGVATFIASVLGRSEPEERREGEGCEEVRRESGRADSIHDSRLVETVLRGRDVLDVALELLRERLKTNAVSFVPVPTATNGRTNAPGGAAPVAFGNALMGFLVAPGMDSETLAPHALWLAGWLRLRDQHADLRNAAFTDPTTGAWNRRYFDRFLASAIEDCRKSRRTLTLMVFDIDDFKKYNDRHGHGAGDEILSETVRLMQSVVRPTDRVCRIGGDEFGVIFHEPEGPREANSRHPDSVCKIAHRFQQQVGRHRFPKLGAQAPGSLSISGGLATFPWDGSTPEQLLERADQRALESKRSGKNALTLGPSAIRREE